MKFLVDCMLGRLATWLRILGFDASYFPESYSRKISYLSIQESRIILTRNRRVSPKRSFKVTHIHHDHVEDQIKQVVFEFKLTIDKNKLFSRCSSCNKQLQKLTKSEVIDKVPVYVSKTKDTFSQCPECNQVYWRGTHEELLYAQLAKMNLQILNK